MGAYDFEQFYGLAAKTKHTSQYPSGCSPGIFCDIHEQSKRSKSELLSTTPTGDEGSALSPFDSLELCSMTATPTILDKNFFEK